MFYKPLLYPLLIQVGITALVWIYLYFTRLSEMARNKIDPQDLVDKDKAGTLLKAVSGPSDNFKNLFEIPVLFYTAILLCLILFIQNSVIVTLAWMFVLLRALHSLIHVTYNRVVHRFLVYFCGTLVLWAMWFMIATVVIFK